MDTFNKLAELFRQFPGIGPRQAKRFVYFLLSRDKSYLEELNTLIASLKEAIVQCRDCFRFFQKRNGTSLCSVCSDPNRDTGELMVVAKDTDLEAIEKSGTYDGRYFVLGGTIPLMEAKTAESIRTKELFAKILAKVKNKGTKEIILALSANTEGEYTSDELRRQLTPLLAGTTVKVSTLGRGLSTGSELEYADKETITSALRNRA